MTEQTELKPIETKIKASKMFWIYFRSQIILFTASSVLGFVMFVVTLNEAIIQTSVYKLGSAFLFMVCTILTLSFCIRVFESIVKAKRHKSTVVTVLYSDFMIMQTKENGGYGEERYCCKAFTVAKEKKRYFKLLYPNTAGNIIPKDGLSPAQLNAVRRAFGLTLDGTDEVALPLYSENGNVVPDMAEVISAENSRVIKSSFGEYLSRDKKILKIRFVISILLGVCCLAGIVFYISLNYKYDIMPTWARVIIWASSLIFMVDATYCAGLIFILKKSANNVKLGINSEYLIFSDCIIVYIHVKDGFSVIRLPYDKITYVRETKEDIWMRAKFTGSGTFPIIKSTLTSAEFATLMSLLSRPIVSAESNIELDSAPPLNGKYKDLV